MREVVIVEAVRSPLGRRKGPLAHISPEDLLALTLKELVCRSGVDVSSVEDVMVGCANQINEQAGNIARNALLMAGFPKTVPGTTLQRQCGSAETALHSACQAILAGDMETVVVAGVESMSRVPLGSARGQTPLPKLLTDKYEIIPQSQSAERIAAKWGLSRGDQDALALQSHQRAISAWAAGHFRREVFPVTVDTPDGAETLAQDDGPRADTTLEKLAGLAPLLADGGTVTAGNASQITNGAAAMLLMERKAAQGWGLKPRARVVARSVVGDDPTLMLTGPIAATRRILGRVGMRVSDVDVIEVNEAFASVVLAWQRDLDADMARVNRNGGAIAIGHPTGCTGARMTVTLLHELERSGGQFGLQTMCIAGGMGTATLLERLAS